MLRSFITHDRWWLCGVASTYLIVLSELPLTTSLSLYCKQAMPRLWPFSVLTNSQDDVFHTLIVLSPDADTIYFWSKSTTLTAARWPTSTRRRLMSVGDCISHTAMDRSYTREHKAWKATLITHSWFNFNLNQCTNLFLFNIVINQINYISNPRNV